MKKMKFLMVLATLLIGSVAWAQDDFMKFGEIDSAGYFVSYPQDTSVSAIVIGEWGRTYYAFFNNVLEYHIRIKVLKESALSYVDNKVSFPRNGDVADLKGITYNFENGKIIKTKLSSENIYTTKNTGDSYIRSFAMPNVRVGSVIEYSYRLEYNMLELVTGWIFQQNIPVLKSVYVADFPNVMSCSLLCENCENVAYMLESKEENRGIKRATWSAANLPPHKNEIYSKNNHNDLVQVEYEITGFNIPGRYNFYPKTYLEYSQNILKYNSKFGNDLKFSGYVSEDVERLTAGKDSLYDKMKVIYDFAKTKFLWNGNYATQSFLGLKYSYENSKGSVADINLNLLLMLKKANIECYPVFLSTRDNEEIVKDQIFIHRFNYVIVCARINGKQYLLDATEPFLKMDELPLRCLNGSGLIINDKAEFWVDLLRNEKYDLKHTINLSINSENQLVGSIKSYYEGYNAIDIRKKIKKTSIEQFIENEKKDNTSKTISNYDIQNVDDADKRIEIGYNFIDNDAVLSGNNKILIAPINFQSSAFNPFSSLERHTPVSFGCPQKELFMINIEIPKGFNVESLPQSSQFKLPNDGGLFTFTVNTIENKITILSRLVIYKTDFSLDEYPFLQEFFNQIINSQQQQIVLKKM